MNKYAVLLCLGDYYSDNSTGFSRLGFTLKNTNDFNAFLNNQNSPWIVSPMLYDKTAGKANIQLKIEDAISRCTNNTDWLLIYYTGHASRLMTKTPAGFPDFITYCVTYSDKLKFNFFPGLDEFFTEIDYNTVIDSFHEKVPNGHLITVLDCCNAFGLIENFGQQTDFHTIISSCSDGVPSYYNTNSAFFTAFRRCWDLPFQQLASSLRSIMASIRAPNRPVTQIANNFSNQSLNG
ncbi:caspase family protein [Danxiaibacter flavus]|uniref:Caspase family protein n=1 Tax=Danxiaibacter flavus TaxID=3049108 RepID=A0ABV3ZJH6_9BACT|nr:caspase family protein [Chitinophagaceae bacterium DXS]